MTDASDIVVKLKQLSGEGGKKAIMKIKYEQKECKKIFEHYLSPPKKMQKKNILRKVRIISVDFLFVLSSLLLVVSVRPLLTSVSVSRD